MSNTTTRTGTKSATVEAVGRRSAYLAPLAQVLAPRRGNETDQNYVRTLERASCVATNPRWRSCPVETANRGKAVRGEAGKCLEIPTPLLTCGRSVSLPNEAWQEWQGSAFARVRSCSLAGTKTLQTSGLSERARTGANVARICHAEGRGFESLHPLQEKPAQAGFLLPVVTV
jgi:hypothetical protein